MEHQLWARGVREQGSQPSPPSLQIQVTENCPVKMVVQVRTRGHLGRDISQPFDIILFLFYFILASANYLIVGFLVTGEV